ncbi:phosphatase PAP2 family protein [Streptomyces termitum]|uniref:phosphatase PAP2 family protein n=1 Tax=Streptomyces termitum TaxID=67368 RepID=UPI0037A03B2A
MTRPRTTLPGTPRPADRPPRTLLPPPLRAGLGTVAVLAALAAALLGVRYAGEGGPHALDLRIRTALEDTGPTGRDLALVVDFLGEPLGAAVLVVALAALCLLLRRPRAAVLAVAGPGTAVVATTLLKPLAGRTINGGHLSYPSGHTAFLTALAVTVALLAAGRLRLGGPAGTLLVLTAGLLAGAAMGGAQVLLDAHYPTDTVGGWCTALAVVPAVALLLDRTAGERPRAGTGG